MSDVNAELQNVIIQCDKFLISISPQVSEIEKMRTEIGKAGRSAVERDYDIQTWDELPSDKRIGGHRLTKEIVAQFPELTRRELTVHNAFCIARKKLPASEN